jgi:hypothetical protein
MSVRMRTVNQCIQYLKEIDPSTCIGPGFLRRRIKDGSIPFVRAGNRKLIDLSNLISYLSTGESIDRFKSEELSNRPASMKRIDL